MERFTWIEFLWGLPLAGPFALAAIILLQRHKGGRLIQTLEVLAFVLGIAIAAHLVGLPAKPVVAAWALMICFYSIAKMIRDGDFR